MKVLHVDSGQDGGLHHAQLLLLMQQLAANGVEQTCVCAAGSPLARRLSQAKLPAEPVGWGGGLALAVRRRVLRHARTTDLIHCHDEPALEASAFGARMRRRPLIATRGRLESPHSNAWARVTRAVALSAAAREGLVAAGVPADRTVVVYPGFNLDEVRSLPPASPRFRERLAIEEDRFVVGTIGPMTEAENQRLIPRAAAYERRIMWVIVGDGPERQRIQSAIAAHGVMANVRIAGSPSDARPYLREFDLFVLAAEADPFAARLLDAMALDVPVIAPDSASPAEILRPVHAQTGASLYPPGDAPALAALVRRVQGDHALRDRMVAAQRARVEDFRIQRMAEATLALYRELAGAA